MGGGDSNNGETETHLSAAALLHNVMRHHQALGRAQMCLGMGRDAEDSGTSSNHLRVHEVWGSRADTPHDTFAAQPSAAPLWADLP